MGARWWPPTRSTKASLLWALILGFVLQIAVPYVLNALGAERAALLSIYPGLFPIVWVTGGWFAGISPLGYVLMFSINTLVYGLVVFVGLRTCAYATGNTVEPV